MGGSGNSSPSVKLKRGNKSSTKLKALSIKTDTGEVNFITHRGKTYPVDGLFSGSPDLDMVSTKSLKQVKANAEAKGWKVTEYSSSNYAKARKQYFKEQHDRPDYALGMTENGMGDKKHRRVIYRNRRGGAL